MAISALEIKSLVHAFAEQAALAHSAPPIVVDEAPAAQGLQILLIEDDEADAYLIRRALAGNPRVVDVVLAEDGEEALDLLDRRRVLPDLVLVDLRMPRKDGLAFLKDLAARPEATYPCAVLTSSKSRKDELRAKTRGAVEFVTKPKAEAKLRSALDRIIAGL